VHTRVFGSMMPMVPEMCVSLSALCSAKNVQHVGSISNYSYTTLEF
jgi:hypothetical protein